ncbi:MAG TPA: hypothetical protein VII03_03645, partial [Solirubrobacteraceae bacterium]
TPAASSPDRALTHGPAACSGTPVARERFGEVQRAAEQMTHRSAPQPGLDTLHQGSVGWGRH